jgi:hypothetical protein
MSKCYILVQQNKLGGVYSNKSKLWDIIQELEAGEAEELVIQPIGKKCTYAKLCKLFTEQENVMLTNSDGFVYSIWEKIINESPKTKELSS